jgi:hypothetical protein
MISFWAAERRPTKNEVIDSTEKTHPLADTMPALAFRDRSNRPNAIL